ncbi:DUF1657 domain-containing protein [Bacillus piscicola]|uniref:DUF1657 domain-containing protein n=1 Tax=Bacillus piscicola TaxID=1632684 RepID=UPI001F08DD66|nr:DUF1657 domain-containing protein [Bacillus piscicola]
MTVASDVKQCLANMKSVEGGLESLALRTEDENAKITFQEAQNILEEIIRGLKRRTAVLEMEEDQYKGF